GEGGGGEEGGGPSGGGVGGEDGRGGAGGGELGRGACIGKEGDGRRSRVVDRRHIDDLDGTVTPELTVENAGEIGEPHGRPFSGPSASRPTIDERCAVTLALPRPAW